jgi:hypothetical protein
MSDYSEQAKRYLVLIEGGPPSNYSAWSPDVPGGMFRVRIGLWVGCTSRHLVGQDVGNA